MFNLPGPGACPLQLVLLKNLASLVQSYRWKQHDRGRTPTRIPGSVVPVHAGKLQIEENENFLSPLGSMGDPSGWKVLNVLLNRPGWCHVLAIRLWWDAGYPGAMNRPSPRPDVHGVNVLLSDGSSATLTVLAGAGVEAL